jgi:hypothetical protein
MSGDIEQQVNTNSAEFKQGVEAGHCCRSLINSEETTNEREPKPKCGCEYTRV